MPSQPTYTHNVNAPHPCLVLSLEREKRLGLTIAQKYFRHPEVRRQSLPDPTFSRGMRHGDLRLSEVRVSTLSNPHETALRSALDPSQMRPAVPTVEPPAWRRAANCRERAHEQENALPPV